jgi:hypothetical protein
MPSHLWSVSHSLSSSLPELVDECLLLFGLYFSLSPPLPELVDECLLLIGLYLSLSPPLPELVDECFPLPGVYLPLCLILYLSLWLNAFFSLVCISIPVFFST